MLSQCQSTKQSRITKSDAEDRITFRVATGQAKVMMWCLFTVIKLNLTIKITSYKLILINEIQEIKQAKRHKQW